MQLIGMLDSPYVRRVAISLRLLNLPFEHRPISVFRTFEQFRQINPVVKAPTLVTDDGTVLMDSTLILQWIEGEGPHDAASRLTPTTRTARLQDLRLTGLALAACEKTVQIAYEHQLRPEDKWHAPWLDRVNGQLSAAYAALEAEVASTPPQAEPTALTHGSIATAVAWSFTQLMLPDHMNPATHPATAAFTEAAERLPAFRACPQVG
ncbi:glutathione S-transferase [Hydrogenophaga sp.]|uniref:glutathione S-transferase n=1 Tax=Hydrogenophaga sp. TaxID=1904254 RepID=UPI00263223C9|nr:glutathione S-transferase [Hydrogenophaga sp.]MCW5655932.1 glutathione S-transferase [Hydrogenophaga sp.]